MEQASHKHTLSPNSISTCKPLGSRPERFMRDPSIQPAEAAEHQQPILRAAGITLLIFVLTAGCDPKPTLGPPPLSPGGNP